MVRSLENVFEAFMGKRFRVVFISQSVEVCVTRFDSIAWKKVSSINISKVLKITFVIPQSP